MPEQNSINQILISVAVEDELPLLTNALDNKIHSSIGGKHSITGQLYDIPVTLIITGPGVVNTAIGLTAAVEHINPSMIIQTGCAGIFKETGAGVGDVGIAECEIDIHTGIEPDTNDSCIPPSELPFPLLLSGEHEITHKYPVHKYFSDTAFGSIQTALDEEAIRVVKGTFITVSTITATDKRARILADAYSPCMESMEGSSAAHVAFHYNLPFVEIRAASNVVGKRDTSQWDLPLAFTRSNTAVMEFIKTIRNK